ncbi:hypothetical protein [Bosea sp. TAF32]|uniref:hypothetical protein n=1 Tax=Bosea sp. TAF32 TaxID=3237482 RepID=UPI003F8F3F3D
MSAIPGFAGWADDLKARAEVVTDMGIPMAWTPEHVQARLVEAFDILARSGTRVGPRQHANGWPAMVHEFADLVDAQARAIAEKERQQLRSARPTADELSRMNEALAWPLHHLDGRPLQSDALMLWAYATALGRDMAAMLHARKKRAMALADEMMKRRNALPWGAGEHGAGDCRAMADQWRSALRRQIAREVSASVPASEAQAVFRARCEASNCMPYRVKPHEAVPDRCLSRTNLDRQRKVAAAAVASGLRRAGVAVR